jgi:hypothetical protein
MMISFRLLAIHFGEAAKPVKVAKCASYCCIVTTPLVCWLVLLVQGKFLTVRLPSSVSISQVLVRLCLLVLVSQNIIKNWNNTVIISANMHCPTELSSLYMWEKVRVCRIVSSCWPCSSTTHQSATASAMAIASYFSVFFSVSALNVPVTKIFSVDFDH